VRLTKLVERVEPHRTFEVEVQVGLRQGAQVTGGHNVLRVGRLRDEGRESLHFIVMLVLAHRGASGYAPENTMAAFALACEMGAPGIETDVQVSRDGVLVLVHDDTVDRTTDGSGAVADLTWDALSRLDAGTWLDARFAGERIVRFDAFLAWRFPRHQVSSLSYPPGTTHGPGAPLGPGAARTTGGWPSAGEATATATMPSAPDDLIVCIEVKVPAAADPLVGMLAARALTDHPAVQLTSFDWSSVLRVHAALPRLAAGFLTPRFDAAEIERVVAAGLDQICPRADLVTPALVARAHARGLQVRAWGVATRAHLAQVAASGADGTTLNWPDWATRSDGPT
jgi:glycerophosphoryl diester phosphodiesterase